MVAVVLISGAVMIAQDRSATVTQINYFSLVGIRTSPTVDVMGSDPEKFGFTFTNTQPINVRMAIYIPYSEYAQSIFPPLTPQEAAIAESSGLRSAEDTKVIGADFIRIIDDKGLKIIRRDEKGFVEPKRQQEDTIQVTSDNDTDSSSSAFRSYTSPSSSPYVWEMSDPMLLQSGTDGRLDDKIAEINDTYFAVWRSDWQKDGNFIVAPDKAPPTSPLQHFEPGTNTAFFDLWGECS